MGAYVPKFQWHGFWMCADAEDRVIYVLTDEVTTECSEATVLPDDDLLEVFGPRKLTEVTARFYEAVELRGDLLADESPLVPLTFGHRLSRRMENAVKVAHRATIKMFKPSETTSFRLAAGSFMDGVATTLVGV